ncbi:MAG: TrmH family RNA methyltransferase, partial [Chloroflexia bacterium]
AHMQDKLSGKTDPSELLALVATPPDDLDRIPVRADLLVLVFDRPASPGNLGTLIRSCDALGAHGLIVTGHAADVYAPETVSASAGSLFALPVVRLGSYRELIPWFESVGARIGDFQLVGTSAKGDQDLEDVDLAGPTVLLLGNETWGLSAAYKELCDVMVRIAIRKGGATSLNVACAGSIVLYEVDRCRRARRRGTHRAVELASPTSEANKRLTSGAAAAIIISA